jgi:hypothetical protein
MAQRPSRPRTPAAPEAPPAAPPPEPPIPDAAHPHFQDGLVSEEGEALRPVPGPLPLPPMPLPRPLPVPERPVPRPDLPRPFPPLNICTAVSGRYRRLAPVSPSGRPLRLPVAMTVRVDVDRFLPQQRISIEARRLLPASHAHVVAEVRSDQCLGPNRRRVEADITYRDGNAGLIPAVRVVFTARRTTGIGYGAYAIELIAANGTAVTHDLAFESAFFDSVEFEVDTVANATATTTYGTGSHPNRPAGLPVETLSFETVFQRAGFEARMSPNANTIPVAGAGANGTWSDAEMHDAMVAHWSRFANRPDWAMWVLFAARHDSGRTLGGVMFDDIGPNHRQGTAIFTNSFIQDVPNGDPNPAAWRNRMVFWTAIHEMGHAFNLAHSWQKSLGTPWVPLANEPEVRSFMNYPYNVAGGTGAFFGNFEFRFSDSELVFMRHAPRRFVQMGNEDWFSNHGFEQEHAPSGEWTLKLRPNRESNRFAFLEPVHLELKLTNSAGAAKPIEHDLLEDGRHVAIIVQREGGQPRKWRPFVTRCHEGHAEALKPGQSLYASHLVGAAPEGWLIHEPGFYTVQAAIELDDEIIRSNALRIWVGRPGSEAEDRLAPDYFGEDVGRVLAFRGAPSLERANDMLRRVVAEAPASAAATHATVALAGPLSRDFKKLEEGGFRTLSAKVEEAAKATKPALLKAPDAAAATLGHIAYREVLEGLAVALAEAGEKREAASVQKQLVEVMEKRGVLPAVVAKSRATLARFSG